MTRQMSKLNAVLAMIREGATRVSSLTSYRQVTSAMKALGLSEAEREDVLHRMCYHEDKGKPMKWLADKLNAKQEAKP